jgi:GNAT superfamily N-acetyltransferase
MTGDCRPADPSETRVLAAIWHDGWQDAHAAILPNEVKRARTPESFEERLAEAIGSVRVIEDDEGPAGFSLLQGDELYQFYLIPRARGSGLAQILMDDAEACFAEAGVTRAWLACAIGNDRAARFYRKAGWQFAGVYENLLDLPTGPYPLEVWRFEKSIAVAAMQDAHRPAS